MSTLSKEKFESLSEPLHWWLTASSMKEAAELVFAGLDPNVRKPSEQELQRVEDGFQLVHPVHDLRSVYVLLVGFCLENLLKAEYVRQQKPTLENGKLPKQLMGHDLNVICGRIGFSALAGEQRMLAIASEAVVSWGRYPGGTRYDHGGTAPPDAFDVEEFKVAFEAVYWRLTEVITEGWADSEF